MTFEMIYQTATDYWVVWLMAIFLAIVVWAFWPKNKERFEAYGRIPLEDEKDEREER